MKTYLFILCPQYSGSTILWKLVSTSDEVSSLPKEGQFIPEVKEFLWGAHTWDADIELPWVKIKEVWDDYWDHEKSILVEKSPPNLIRTREILKHFKPVYFIIMVRNPYAHCEGLMRKNGWDSTKAAQFSVRCLRQQAENASNLPNSIHFTYEEMADDPESISYKIQSFLPQIGELRYSEKFNVVSIDGKEQRRIANLNEKKIKNLRRVDINRINSLLRENADVMDYWDYKYYEPSLSHDLSHLLMKVNLLLSRTFYRIRRAVGKIIGRSKRQGCV